MPDLSPLFLSLRLAVITALILLVLGGAIAWRLAQMRSSLKPVIEAIVALPLVLPPTVLGFYLLIAFNPTSPLGAAWLHATGDTLTFSFTGLVIASVIYSLPFAVQPLQAAFEGVSNELLEAGASLGAKPLDRFFTIAAPQSIRGFLTAGILSFAHTLGEFGVVLMIGGAIPGKTRLVSIAIYEHVETLAYAQAHILSLILLFLTFSILLCVYAANRYFPAHVR